MTVFDFTPDIPIRRTCSVVLRVAREEADRDKLALYGIHSSYNSIDWSVIYRR